MGTRSKNELRILSYHITRIYMHNIKDIGGNLSMNDRFRFRAWDKERKLMFYDVQNAYDMQGEHHKTHEFRLCSFGEVLNDNGLIVMQCTGLKDKHGTLIYEGDVVYLAGYGEYGVEHSWVDLFHAEWEGDIGGIIGNRYEGRK